MLDISLELKTKGDMTLESRGADGMTWDEADFAWDDGNPDTWDRTLLHSELEAKTKADLSLESK